MTKILGVLLCDSETAFSSMPLLGKPCAEHVKAAMIAAGADADAFAQEESFALRVRYRAVCGGAHAVRARFSRIA